MKRRTSTSGAAKGDTGHDRRQAIYDELIRARGGPAAFSTVQISVARTAVRMLARDDLDAQDAGVLSELLRFLPPERTEPPLDMTKLPDAQFDAFCKSVAIMRGEALPPRTVRTQSPRWRDAKRLCAVLDCTEARQAAGRRAHGDTKPRPLFAGAGDPDCLPAVAVASGAEAAGRNASSSSSTVITRARGCRTCRRERRVTAAATIVDPPRGRTAIILGHLIQDDYAPATFTKMSAFGAKRTCHFAVRMSAFDPKRTSKKRRGIRSTPIPSVGNTA